MAPRPGIAAGICKTLATCLLLALSSLIFIVLFNAREKTPEHEKTYEYLLLLPLFLAPHVFAGIQVWRRPSLGYGAAVGVAMAECIGMIEFWVLLVLLDKWPSGTRTSQGYEISYRAALLSLPLSICLLVAGFLGFAWLERDKKRWVDFLLPAMLLPPFFVVLDSYAFHKLGKEIADHTTQAYKNNYRANDILMQMELCALQYAAKHGETQYPSDLGKAGGEAACGAFSNSYSAAGYGFRYVPQQDGNGVSHFRLEAAPERTLLFPTGTLHMRTDESGVLTRAAGFYVPDRHLHALQQAYSCAKEYKRARGRYPADLDAMVQAKLRVKTGNWQEDCLCINSYSNPDLKIAEERLWLSGYFIEYHANREGTVFEISARPQRYGATFTEGLNLFQTRGFRSYFVGPDGQIHATPFDRRASSQDPVAPACEFEFRNCFPT